MKLLQYHAATESYAKVPAHIRLGLDTGNGILDVRATVEKAEAEGAELPECPFAGQKLPKANAEISEEGKSIKGSRICANSALPKTMDEVIEYFNIHGEIASLEKAYTALEPVYVKMCNCLGSVNTDDNGNMLPDLDHADHCVCPKGLPFTDYNLLKLAPVVSDPEKILCIGLNYKSHMAELDFFERGDFPPVFCKFNNALSCHKGEVKLPELAHRYDYEAELVIVIGRTAHDVSVEDAGSCIFGYTCGDDLSCRDAQTLTSQWTLGKGMDGFGPVGPVIVTADSIDADNLDIAAYVNGIERQYSNTSNMLYSCREIVSYLSGYMTLKPGDLIFTGTPGGVMFGRPESEQVWLKAGDRVEIWIEGIGTLESRLV